MKSIELTQFQVMMIVYDLGNKWRSAEGAERERIKAEQEEIIAQYQRQMNERGGF